LRAVEQSLPYYLRKLPGTCGQWNNLSRTTCASLR
jgi:hypothetical protein